MKKSTNREIILRLKIKKIFPSLQITNAGKAMERREPSYTVGGNVNWFSHYEGQYGGSLKS